MFSGGPGEHFLWDGVSHTSATQHLLLSITSMTIGKGFTNIAWKLNEMTIYFYFLLYKELKIRNNNLLPTFQINYDAQKVVLHGKIQTSQQMKQKANLLAEVCAVLNDGGHQSMEAVVFLDEVVPHPVVDVQQVMRVLSGILHQLLWEGSAM